MTAAAQTLAPTPTRDLDAVIDRVRGASSAFAKLDINARIRLCEEMRQGYRDVAEESVRAACQAKGIPFDSPVSGEEWLAGPMVTIRNLRLLSESLKDIRDHGAPRIDPSWVRSLPDGRIAVRVYPT